MLTAALRRRPTEGAALLGVAAVAMVVGGTVIGDPGAITQPGYLAAGGQWLVLGAIVTFAADTMRQLMQPAENTPQPYAEATRLLTQLRSVARSLPGATLDPGGISEHLLEELRVVAPANRAAGAVRERRWPARGAGTDRRRTRRLGDHARRRLGDRRRVGHPAAADRQPVAGPLAPGRRGVVVRWSFRWSPASVRSVW